MAELVVCKECKVELKMIDAVHVWDIKDPKYPNEWMCKECCKDIPFLREYDESGNSRL